MNSGSGFKLKPLKSQVRDSLRPSEFGGKGIEGRVSSLNTQGGVRVCAVCSFITHSAATRGFGAQGCRVHAAPLYLLRPGMDLFSWDCGPVSCRKQTESPLLSDR